MPSGVVAQAPWGSVNSMQWKDAFILPSNETCSSEFGATGKDDPTSPLLPSHAPISPDYVSTLGYSESKCVIDFQNQVIWEVLPVLGVFSYPFPKNIQGTHQERRMNANPNFFEMGTIRK